MSDLAQVGIVAAMRLEIAPLVRTWQREQIVNKGRRFTLYRSGAAVATAAGPTKESAATATNVLVETCAPRVLLSVGFAGALSAGLHTGDVVLPELVVDADTGESYATSAGRGVLVTSPQVAGRDRKAELARRWSALAVDMEATAVAEIAQARGCDFAAVKAISDDATAEVDFVGRFVTPRGFRTAAFLAHVVVRPSLWTAVRELRINSERASLNLSSTLRDILSSKEGIAGALAGLGREHAESRN